MTDSTQTIRANSPQLTTLVDGKETPLSAKEHRRLFNEAIDSDPTSYSYFERVVRDLTTEKYSRHTFLGSLLNAPDLC